MSELTQHDRNVINGYAAEFLKVAKELGKAVNYAVEYYRENEQAIVSNAQAKRAAAEAYNAHVQKHMDELDDSAELRAERKKLLQERDDTIISLRHDLHAYTVCRHLIDQLSNWYHTGGRVNHCGVTLTTVHPALPCARFINNAKRLKCFKRGIEIGAVAQDGQRSGEGLLSAGFVLMENFDKTKFDAIYEAKPLEIYAPVLGSTELAKLYLCKNATE